MEMRTGLVSATKLIDVEFAVVAALEFAKRVGNCQRVDGERFATAALDEPRRRWPVTSLSLNYYQTTPNVPSTVHCTRCITFENMGEQSTTPAHPAIQGKGLCLVCQQRQGCPSKVPRGNSSRKKDIWPWPIHRKARRIKMTGPPPNRAASVGLISRQGTRPPFGGMV